MKIKFGTDGWRAVLAVDFTFSNARRVACGIKKFLKGEKGRSPREFLIGYDTRFLAEELAAECAEALSDSFNVFVTKTCVPTPVLAYAIQRRKALGGIMLTASHNPPEYQGIKFIPHYAGPALPDITDAIEKLIPDEKGGRGQVAGGREEIKMFDPFPSYFAHIEKLVDFDVIKKAKLKIVYDPLYATGAGVLDKLLVKHGCAVEVLHHKRDVLFGGSMPDPGEYNLKELKERVRKTKAHLGVATDGDSDRFAVVDARGNYYSPNQLLSMLLRFLLKYKGNREPGTGNRFVVARTVATTHMLDALCEKYGGAVEETPVGFKYIGQVMREKNALIGGEESGGVSISGHVPEKDGILGCLLACEMAAREKKPLYKIYEDLQKEVGHFYSKRLDLHLSDDNKRKLMENLRKSPPKDAGKFYVNRIITMDGCKMVFTDGSWMLFRASGTEPLVRVYLEAKSKPVLLQLEKVARKILKKYAK